MSKYPSIIIVEDQEHTLNRLADAIRSNPQLNLVGTADCAVDGLRLLEELRPDILLTDLNLPDGSGVDLIRHASNSGSTDSIVITVFGDEKHVVTAIRAGATGYLLKDCDADRVGEAVLQVVDGGSPISPSIARYLLKVFQSDSVMEAASTASAAVKKDKRSLENGDGKADTGLQCNPPLTRREHEVLRLIAKGFSYQEIAESLHLSIHTVTSHIKHIYRKLAVGSRGEAVYEAGQIGLL